MTRIIDPRTLVTALLGITIALTGAPAPTAYAATDAPTVRSRLSTQESTVGERVRFGGRVAGAARPRGRIALQERRPDGRWVRVALRRTNPRGGYRFVVTPSEGRHVYRARAWRHAGQRPAVSRVRRVVVRPADTTDGTSTTSELAGVRARILDDTNAARARRDLPPLRALAGAHDVAQRWTAGMADRGELAHNPSYAEQMPRGWTRVAENVAYGYEPGAVVDAWMDSSGHRANILGDHTHLGVGFVRDDRGRAWYTQNFGKY